MQRPSPAATDRALSKSGVQGTIGGIEGGSAGTTTARLALPLSAVARGTEPRLFSDVSGTPAEESICSVIGTWERSCLTILPMSAASATVVATYRFFESGGEGCCGCCFCCLCFCKNERTKDSKINGEF